MLTERLRERTPSAQAEGVGFLPGYTLTFEKASVGQSGRSGKGDIRETRQPADRVFGVLFRIPRAEESALDDAEGSGYAKREVEAQTDGGVRRAVAYIAKEKTAGLHPYHWYKALIIAGAVQHGLPRDYIDGLWAFESQRDPLRNRTKKLEAETLLKSTGLVWDWYRQAQGE